ncbi:MAG: helix-turn-helix domain-containing protein [Oscillospiraceae bacterium]|nr:helix-turn-helix domain-containing protein [Oscillospiraceae bacterium]
MDIKSIGNIIAKLRKEKGSTQEELAKYTQVSTQAVSKWENGGIPDTELLPKIADYFGVSIDTLFGRNITDYSDIENALAKKVWATTWEERFNTAFELCWIIQTAHNGDSIKKIQGELGDTCQIYSTVDDDSGFTLMGLSRRLPYFLIAPECKDKNLAFFEGIDYVVFFKDFSDKAVFDTMILLNKREQDKGFTPNWLIKNLKIETEKATEVINILKKYNLINTTQLEMDDTTQEIYTYRPTPSFVALLIFAREMIDRPTSWRFCTNNRTKPYLS